MDLEFSPEQQAFREEIRTFLADTVTAEMLAVTKGATEAFVPEFHKELASRGYIGIQWPKEYGGQGRSPVDVAIFYEELGRALAPVGRYVGSSVFVGGSIIHFGSPEQKGYYLPKIAAGLLGSMSLTEPNAGSDAASITSSAALDGDEWVINGEKVFITGADLAEVIMASVRTEPDAARHDGISLFLIPADAAGIEVRRIPTLAGLNVNTVSYRDVRVPAGALLGERGHGWKMIQTTFSLERSVSSANLVGSIFRLFHDVLRVVLADVEAGRLPASVLEPLADCRAELEAARLLSYRATWLDANGGVPLHEAATAKLTRSELALRVALAGLEALGEKALVSSGPASVIGGRLEAMYRRVQFNITAGGTNDIQRNILAQQGLGLPRR